MLLLRTPPRRHLLSAFGCLLLLCWMGSAGANAVEVKPAKGWRYRVAAQQLASIDDIVVSRDGDAYVTQVLENGDGRILRVRVGRVDVIASGLDRPRGLLLKKNHVLYVAEKANDGRVIVINLENEQRRVINGLHSPEHIARLPDGDVIVTENGVSGRLVRLPKNGTIEVITAGLNNPEGLAVAHDGTIYIGESGTGRVLRYKDGAVNVAVDDLDEPSQIECTPDGALWVTERGNPGRLLRLKDGTLETVLTGLADPRSIAATENGGVMVTETGRERILIVEPKQ